MRTYPAVTVSALLAACLLTGACGDKTKQPSGVQQPPPDDFVMPQTLFAYTDRVYALDSNADTLEVAHPTTSVEQLPFDVPPLSAYRRDANTEWISARPGYVWERKVGQKEWARFQIDSGFRTSLVFEGSLYIEHRLPGQTGNNQATVSRFEKGSFEKSWTTAYAGMSRSSPPTFLDEDNNLARISGGEKVMVLKAEDLPFHEVHGFRDVFAAGWVHGTAFATQGSSLHIIHNGVATGIDLTVASWMSVAAEGEFAWVVGTRANRVVIAHYFNGSWKELDLGEADSVRRSMFSAGRRACLVESLSHGKYQVTILADNDEGIAHETITVNRKLFGTELGVVYADGFWWISTHAPGDLVKIDANPSS